MKLVSLTAAAALALAGSMANAQTESSDTTRDTPPHFGEKWGGMVGSQFFTDTTMGTLRGNDEVLNAWQSMTEEQQAMVKADCDLAKASGTEPAASSTDNTSAGTDSPSTAAGNTGGTAAGSDTSGNSSNGGTDATAETAPVFVSQDNMVKLCTIVAP